MIYLLHSYEGVCHTSRAASDLLQILYRTALYGFLNGYF